MVWNIKVCDNDSNPLSCKLGLTEFVWNIEDQQNWVAKTSEFKKSELYL